MAIEFRREVLVARYRRPDGTAKERQAEIRFDPLLGTSSRIAPGVTLPKADAAAAAAFQSADPSCPFCPPRLEQVTPLVLPEISAEGRMRSGETVLFPNLVPYSKYAVVAIFSSRHWLGLHDFTTALIRDNLAAVCDYARKVYAFDSLACYCAYNINYLYPSGGSLPHSHSQVFLDTIPSNMIRLQHEAGQRYAAQHRSSFWEDLVSEERERGERFLGSIGAASWFMAFAPVGFNEVRAVVRERETLLDLTPADITAVADGISRVLQWYSAFGYNSFNLALYSGKLGGCPGFRVNLAMITRSGMAPFYRSDAMYLERLHWEAAVDRAPELACQELRPRFEMA